MNVVDFVKRIILLFVVVLFVVNTPLAHAQTITSIQRANIVDRIEALLAQVHKLQRQLALQQKDGASKSAAFSYKTKFYTGSYEALYLVDGTKLIPASDADIRNGDQLLWNTFLKIAGNTLGDAHVSEFRIYNDPKSEISAFVEEKPDHTWILGFNREGESISDIYADKQIVDLLLHEYGHIVFFSDPSIEKEFKNTFWKSKQNAGDFITTYAHTSAVEDLAESFVYFVTAEKPTQEGVQYDKVRFFYSYPELTSLRTQLRTSTLF